MSQHTQLTYEVPADYGQAFAEYYPLICRLVAWKGIVTQDVEDVAMRIFMKFMEHDVLKQYDPERREGNFAQRRATFTTFLSRFVLTYVQHYVYRQSIVAGRHVEILEAAGGVSEVEYHRSLSTGAEILQVEDDHDEISMQDTVRSIRAALLGRETLSIMFEEILVQMEEHGRIHKGWIQAKAGLSKHDMAVQYARLQEVIARATAVA